MSNKEKISSDEIKAFIGEGTTFKGVLMYEGTIRIDGRVEGEIITEGNLVVGKNAVVEAEIKVGKISINGKVVGSIIAKDVVEIHSSGRVYGDIRTPALVIEEGVIFQGNCQMEKDQKKFPLVGITESKNKL
jgi:cytoskeletal protein CcmA (bactofilin family)